MEWITINDESEIPLNKNVIVEDVIGCIGYAYFNDANSSWELETFGRTKPVVFDKIIRYFVIPV
jgi:hypothetical protein